MVNVWRNFPFSAIVLLAGFTSVPNEVLDAARVDGTTFFQRFRHVVVPMISPILLIGFLFDTVFTLSDLGVVYLLTQGGPGTSTLVLVYHIYNEAFISWDLGYSSMVALVLFFVVLAVTVIQFRYTRQQTT